MGPARDGVPMQALRRALAGGEVTLPAAVLDLDALRDNADLLVARAHGRPIRVASKSVRCRRVLAEALGRPGFAGVMAYSCLLYTSRCV